MQCIDNCLSKEGLDFLLLFGRRPSSSVVGLHGGTFINIRNLPGGRVAFLFVLCLFGL